MIRTNIQIQNYDPQDGYHFQIIRLSNGEIIKDIEILPQVIEDNLFGVKFLHYLDHDQNEEEILGDMESEFILNMVVKQYRHFLLLNLICH